MKEKEKKILEASLKLFVEKGFHGTSTAEIAKTAGVATGTLFHYFKTKEELINRLYLYTKESMFSQMVEQFEEDKTLKKNLKHIWSKFIYFSIKNPYKFQFILIFHTSPYITSLTKEQLETQTDALFGIYKKGIQDKELKKVPFEIIIEYFWGNIVSTINYFNKYPEKLRDENLDQAFELFWDGVSR
ncbi:MAG TPA: TetR/AcrR family transcriptional regulator [Methanobacterium sp.]|nr:TetR/AcrR family transcriptional regulator [Methanobacterium sp.]